MNIKEIAEKYTDYMIERRRYFHTCPEASLHEVNTTNVIVKELEDMGLEVHRFEGMQGCYATLKGGKPGKTVLLRADIDGLSVAEKTGLPYASKNEGFMHACGHDAHISTQLGAAKILCEIKDELEGNVKIFFQPAEEIGFGAKEAVKQGICKDVDVCFGMHIWSQVDAPKINFATGYRMASADVFTVKFHGFSSHGSAPHLGHDAILAASNFILTLQSVVSRINNPLNPLVVSIGKFYGGQRFNIIANEVELEGTTRTFDKDARMEIEGLLKTMADGAAASYGCTAEIEYNYLLPSVNNADANAVKLARNAVTSLYGDENLVEFEKITGSEDFSYLLDEIPGVFGFIGARNPNIPGSELSNHHECFTVDEESLTRGAAVTAQFAYDFLAQK